MTEDPHTEAIDIVARVLQATRQGDHALALNYVRANLERFRLLGKREAIAEMRQELTKVSA